MRHRWGQGIEGVTHRWAQVLTYSCGVSQDLTPFVTDVNLNTLDLSSEA